MSEPQFEVLVGADLVTGELPDPTKAWIQAFIDAGLAEALAPVTTGLTWSGAVDLTELALMPRILHATLTGNVTITLPTPPSAIGYTVTLRLKQDGTGSRTLTWPGDVVASYDAPPTLSTAPNAIDVVHLLWTGTEWLALGAAMAVA